MIQYLINKLHLDDYFFIVNKNNQYNSTDKAELHSLNSERHLTCGMMNCLVYVFRFKYSR